MQQSTVRYDLPGRFIFVYGPGWIAKIEFRTCLKPFWLAVELDDWGGFRRRLYDGKE